MTNDQDEVVKDAQRSSEPLMSQPADATNANAPQWVQDFPVDTEQDNYIARRDFTKFMVLTSGAFAVGQLWIGMKSLGTAHEKPLGEKRIAGVEDLSIGKALTFNYPGEHDPCLLIRMSESQFVAYSQKCTHLSCTVVPGENNTLHCPCHQGVFDRTTGRPLAGPPRRPLPRITLQVRNGAIYATGVEVSMV